MAHHMTCSRTFGDLSPRAVGRIATSLPIEHLEVRRGGPGANIAAGLAHLGLRPVLVGAVGADFAGYSAWLEAIGVDTASLHVAQEHQSARCVCITDADGNSFSGYYAGVLDQPVQVDLAAVAARHGGVDLVVVGGNDADTLLRITDECREHGYRFVSAPATQLPGLGNERLRRVIDGAEVLFVDDDYGRLLAARTGWGRDDLLRRVGALVTVIGAADLRIERAGRAVLEVAAPSRRESGDLVGVDDALLVGFVAGLSRQAEDLLSARIACTLASLSLDGAGGSGYDFEPGYFLERLAGAYGDSAADAVEALLPFPAHDLPAAGPSRRVEP